MTFSLYLCVYMHRLLSVDTDLDFFSVPCRSHTHTHTRTLMIHTHALASSFVHQAFPFTHRLFRWPSSPLTPQFTALRSAVSRYANRDLGVEFRQVSKVRLVPVLAVPRVLDEAQAREEAR